MGGYRRNLVGKKYGKITVIEQIRSDRQGLVWKCLCECGNYTTASSGALNTNKRISCGCAHIGNNNSRFTGYRDISGAYWNYIKKGAQRRNLEFSITKEQVWNLYELQNKKCALSGLDIQMSSSYTRRIGIHTASLDRIDNELGYILSNVQWVHSDINIMKNDHDQSYFIKLCKRVAGARR